MELYWTIDLISYSEPHQGHHQYKNKIMHTHASFKVFFCCVVLYFVSLIII